MKKNILKLSSALLALVLCLSAVSPVKAASETQSTATIRITQVDTSAFPTVKVYVSVTDANGEPLAVDPSTLVLMENGITMTPEKVSGKGQTGALATMLVIDVSGSMDKADKLNSAKAVAKSYVEQMRPNDQAGIIWFNTQNQIAQPITADRAALTKAIDALTAGGDTSMYNALGTATEALNPLTGRKAIIALTDGMDNHSTLTVTDVVKSIGEKGLTISTVGFGEPGQPGALAGIDEPALRKVADESGGLYGYANDKESLAKIFGQYGRALQSEYEITYISPSYLRDGLNRSLTVTLASGDMQGASGTTQTRYNPGGLVPEVASGQTWPLFLGLFAALVLFLAVPFGLEYAGALTPGKAKSRIKLVSAEPTSSMAPARTSRPAPGKSRIKLK